MGVVLAVSLLGCNKAKQSNPEDEKPKALNVAPGDPAAGRNVILQMPFDKVAELAMKNIGYAYKLAYAANGKPPKNMEELGVEPRNLRTKRDMQDRDVEVLYGVDVMKLQAAEDYMLAWEKTPDNGGGRMVLMADMTTVRYMTTDVFEKMKKAK